MQDSKTKNSKLLDKINNFPDTSGVYLMKDGDGKIIYIGKAKSIKKRVRSYFTAPKDSRLSIRFLVPKIKQVEFIVTKSEKEALILENTLIKKYRPKYNIDLKDDKTYFSLKVTVKKKFPKITLTRKIKKDGSIYFGPYTSSSAIRETIALMRDIFLLRTCSDSNLTSAGKGKRSRACINYQIKKCSAPCMGYISEDEYNKSVAGAIMFLKGDTTGLLKILKTRMEKESQELNFEEAARIRDQIKAVKLTLEKQRAVTHKKGLNNDIIGVYKEGGDYSISVINVRGGSVVSVNNHIFLNSRLEEDEIASSFIKQFYHADREIPNEILLNKETDELLVIKEWLSEKRGRNVNIKVPKRGEARRIMEMALENAIQSLINKIKSKSDMTKKLVMLKEKLHLKNIPGIIECYDISNIMGRQAVGSKVVLKDGAFDKNSYRKYKIKTRKEADDYGMMYEVLKRRFKRIDEDDKRPDLILIDGGKGHLGIALKIIEEMGIKGVDIISIAKEKTLKTGKKEERIYIPGRKNPIVISGLGGAFNMLITLRDEAHRFAITYHKRLRATKAFESIFDTIKGIGPKKKEAILTHISGLDDLTEEKLQQIKGLSKNDIVKILKILNS